MATVCTPRKLSVPFEAVLIDMQWRKYLATMTDRRKNEAPSSLQPIRFSPYPDNPSLTLDYYQLKQNIDGLDYVLKYTFNVPSSDPILVSGRPLYIAFHGGGGAATSVNDQAWYTMQNYYRKSALDASGIYVAARGIPNRDGKDEWNLHFTDAGYTLLERLIENMVLFENVDSNRVYMLGFSAGGDAIYRLSTKLSQRLAAANMSAGHDGGTPLINLMNVPLCVQAGESDSGRRPPPYDAFDRSKRIADCGISMIRLKSDYLNSTSSLSYDYTNRRDLPIYRYDVYLHPTPGPRNPDTPESEWKHNSWESDSLLNAKTRPVVQDWITWRQQYVQSDYEDLTKFDWTTGMTTPSPVWSVDSNGVRWVSRYTRDPIPQTVVWDLNTRAPKAPSQNYWLAIDDKTTTDYGSLISASYNPANNTITVLSAKNYLRILLRSDMIDYNAPVTVRVQSQNFANGQDSVKVFVKLDRAIIENTCLRSDKNLMFSADVILRQDSSGVWTASTSTPPCAYSMTATVSMRTNRVDAFAIGANDGKIWHRWLEGGKWSTDGWLALGSQQFLAPPSVCSERNGQMTLVGVGTDGQCYYRRWQGNGWQPNKSGAVDWQAISGQFSSPVTAVADPTTKSDFNVKLLGIDINGECQQRALGNGNATDPPDKWTSLGSSDPIDGQLVGPLSAIFVDRASYIFTIDSNKYGRFKNVNSTNWRKWAGYVTGPPALTSFDGTHVDCFWAEAEGTLRHYINRSREPNWTLAFSFSGRGFKTVPAAVAWNRGEWRNDIFCLDSNTDQVYTITQIAARWSDPTALNGKIGNSPNVVSWAKGRLDLVSLDTTADRGGRHQFWADGRGWGSDLEWTALGGQFRNDL